MHKYKFPLLPEKEHTKFYDALHFMKMSELKKGCLLISLPHSGNKNELIIRIMNFIQTGHITQLPKMPPQSLAKNRPPQSLIPSGLMLYGAYKNDAKSREFFKTLIGNHFHFTAFGIDWLNARWHQGNPPTYQEFALYWIDETQKNKHEKRPPKKEWAYINFLQRMQRDNPLKSKDELMAYWQKIQAQHADYALSILESIATRIKK